MGSDKPHDKHNDLVEDFEDLTAESSSRQSFSEDLTGASPAGQGKYEDDVSGLSAGEALFSEDLTGNLSALSGGGEDLTAPAGGAVDESIFEDLIGSAIEQPVADEIEDLLADDAFLPDFQPVRQAPAAQFAEPVQLGVHGREIEATLAEPFMPAVPVLTLHPVSGLTETRLGFADLDFVGLVAIPKELTGAAAKTMTEIVETFGGRKEQVEVITGPGSDDHGIFALAIDRKSRFQYFFFPRDSVKLRQQIRRIGEILLAKGLIGADVLEASLAKQQKMRGFRLGQILARLAGITPAQIDDSLRTAWLEFSGDTSKPAGEILVKAGLVTQKQVDDALKLQEKFRRKKIGELLVEEKHIAEDALHQALAEKFRKAYVDLTTFVPSEEAGGLLPRALALRLRVYPLAVDNGRLLLATANPEMAAIADILKRELGCSFELAVTPLSQLKAAILRKYSN